MNLIYLILFDVISSFIFFPIVNLCFKHTSINKYFVNFPILYLKENNKLNKIFYNMRGREYNLDNKGKKTKTHYFVTTWSILHAVYFFYRGLFIPNLYIYHFFYSIIFEIIEIYFKCHDAVDVIINMVFYYLGSITSPNLSKIPLIRNIPIFKFK